jgi:prepilin-type N-terminal cleavage/methylation domain-containing protein
MKTEPITQLREGRRQKAECRRQPQALRVTFHVSRFTPQVSRITHHAPRGARAFTLIELLIVISVIAALAALTFPAVRGARLSVMRSRARSEMIQIESAIERYQQKLGYYPPDNPGNWELNQLYYELLGTTNIGTAPNNVYFTLDGSSRIKASDFNAAFPGLKVTGFMNCARAGRGDEAPSAVSFLTGLKSSQFTVLTNPSGPFCTILVSGLPGPPLPGGLGATINPWRYNSSSPQHNRKTFDLWVDVLAGNKTNRICNWSEKPLTVYYTSTATEYP